MQLLAGANSSSSSSSEENNSCRGKHTGTKGLLPYPGATLTVLTAPGSRSTRATPCKGHALSADSPGLLHAMYCCPASCWLSCHSVVLSLSLL